MDRLGCRNFNVSNARLLKGGRVSVFMLLGNLNIARFAHGKGLFNNVARLLVGVLRLSEVRVLGSVGNLRNIVTVVACFS